MARPVPRTPPVLRRLVLAAVLLVLALVSPGLALDALANPAPVICRTDGGPATPDHHAGCALCPACEAPSPVLDGAAAVPLPRLSAFNPAPPHGTPPPAPPQPVLAQPRGPPQAV